MKTQYFCKMKSRFTNYDQSSSGLNLELHCFVDQDAARWKFDENFQALNTPAYCRNSFLYFTDCGQTEAPDYLSECYNFDKCTRRDFRAFVLDQSILSKAAGDWIDRTARDVITERLEQHDSWQDMAIEILDEIELYEAARDEFPVIPGAVELYEVVTASGHCQGDYALILFKRLDWMSADFNAAHYFSQMIFDAPIYCRLEINGEEYYLEEGLPDLYDYDRDTLKNYAAAHIPDAQHKQVAEFLEENLPEYPECA